MLNSFPKLVSKKIIVWYSIALITITIIFSNNAMPMIWWIWGLAEVILFCVGSSTLSHSWSKKTDKDFEKNIFIWSFLISAIYVLVTYYLYISLRGEPFEYDPSDGLAYHEEAIWGSQMFESGHFKDYWDYYHKTFPISDTGYQIYLNIMYMFTGGNIFITRIFKCVYRAFLSLLIYRLAKRNFGESVARMAAIFCMFLPNFSFYTASHRKEIEMIVLAVLCIERTDHAIRLKKFNIKSWIIPFLVTAIGFTFRTVLGISLLFAIIATIVFTSEKLISKQRRVAIIILVLSGILALGGGAIANEVEQIAETRINGLTGKTIEWRSKGNNYAQYATGVIMAPLIVAVPFPSMTDNYVGQYNQQRLNGGYFIKNILALFIIFSIIRLIENKQLRLHVVLYSYTFCYLIIISLSNFAHSERFHLPALPFLLIMAAYGICNLNKREYKYFNYYLPLVVFVALIWNFIKLNGRGLI